MSDEMPDKVWIDTVELDETNTMRVHGTCPPDSPEPGDIEYLRNPYGDDGVVVSKRDAYKVQRGGKMAIRWGADIDRIAALEAKLAEAEAVIAKLPRTADGVPLTPSMTVFNKMAEPMDVLYVEALMVRTSRGWFDVDACYSTPEAAKEARDAT